MIERRYGFEVESTIEHPLVNKKPPDHMFIFPAIDSREDEIELGRGSIPVLGQGDIGYALQYNNFWGHFEVVVDPFYRQETLSHLLPQVYDIAQNLPKVYTPWKSGNYFFNKENKMKFKEEILVPEECQIDIRDVDISCEVGLGELGLTEAKIPEQEEDKEGMGEWYLGQLDYDNLPLQLFFEDAEKNGIRVIPQLRKINGIYVLHTNFRFNTMPRKAELTDSLEWSTAKMVNALEENTERKLYLGVTV